MHCRMEKRFFPVRGCLRDESLVFAWRKPGNGFSVDIRGNGACLNPENCLAYAPARCF